MTQIISLATINRPIEAVFEYVTTPGHWPEWHPSSLGVSGATDHSLQVGEQAPERFLAAGRRGEVVWTAPSARRRAAGSSRAPSPRVRAGAAW